MKMRPTYVLITPARNEAAFIGLTIESVISQTVLPLRWVIVSDGSTDSTDDIVRKYAAEHAWIELIRMPERRERNFAGKVDAFHAGLAQVRNLSYDVVASLDGDISFDDSLFAFLLDRLAEDRQLGLAGAPFRQAGTGDTYDFRLVNIAHVSGPCQFFRRECFEDIGGYTPVKGGSIDRIAVLTARMKGWKTRTFPEKHYIHHRPMGSAQSSWIKVWYRDGVKDYNCGSHPLWEILRSIYQMSKKPFVVGGLVLLFGYSWCTVRRLARPVSSEVIAFQRREQMQRLMALLRLSPRPDAVTTTGPEKLARG